MGYEFAGDRRMARKSYPEPNPHPYASYPEPNPHPYDAVRATDDHWPGSSSSSDSPWSSSGSDSCTDSERRPDNFMDSGISPSSRQSSPWCAALVSSETLDQD